MLKETEFGDKSRRYYLTRTEEYVDGLKAALGIWCAARVENRSVFELARCCWLEASRAPESRFRNRQLIRSKKISMEDGLEARKLVNFPGGLELHIGVRWPSTAFLALPGDAFLARPNGAGAIILLSAGVIVYFLQASTVRKEVAGPPLGLG